MVALTYREARAAEYETIAAMHYKLWKKTHQGVLKPFIIDSADEAMFPGEYRRLLARAGWKLHVADNEGEIVGLIIFGPDPLHPDRVEIDSIYVSEQRKGIGSHLLSLALQSQPGADATLWVLAGNNDARKFYEKHHFRLDGRRQDYPVPAGVLTSPEVGYTRRA
ncbi:GNAT family N-acetyltransferase [Mycolicibacterium palauense]|uniref:GNAT family N-acetyltransferase n=1 Tax=Mycolicibacterium palauense TaxID=2034511 RepID=UPI00159BE6CC|nr:GNAT family N-acetyltransferase [Mycolicibacterium palauense]